MKSIRELIKTDIQESKRILDEMDYMQKHRFDIYCKYFPYVLFTSVALLVIGFLLIQHYR